MKRESCEAPRRRRRREPVKCEALGAGNTAGVARLQQVTILQGHKGWKARAGPFQAAWRIISEEYVRRHTVELGDGGLLGNAVQWNRALPLEELGEVLREHGVHTEYLPQGHKPGLHGGRPMLIGGVFGIHHGAPSKDDRSGAPSMLVMCFHMDLGSNHCGVCGGTTDVGATDVQDVCDVIARRGKIKLPRSGVDPVQSPGGRL